MAATTTPPIPRLQSHQQDANPTNPSYKLHERARKHSKLNWITQPTAIVIIHGIGNQQPLSTLDAFAQGVCRAYDRQKIKLRIEHGLREEHDPEIEGTLFDNYIRLCPESSPQSPCMDIFEYYWAPKTEDQATFEEIQDWLKDAARQAGKFYNNDFLPNASLGTTYADSSFFFKVNKNPKPGEPPVTFRSTRYRWVLSFFGFIIPFTCWLGRSIQRLIESIPLIGTYAASALQKIEQSQVRLLSNVIGDITIYNTHNALSKRLVIRRQIIQGGVDLVQNLIQPDPKTGTWKYGRVIIAGHSLGSEVGFDILNRLNLYCSQGLIKGFLPDGQVDPRHPGQPGGFSKLSELISSLVTFGSPLDKVAFFLREQAEENEHIRRQIIENYRGFKQRRWELAKSPEFEVHNQIRRVLDDMKWINYHDSNDYVSGQLDYYGNLENVDCAFPQPQHQKKLWSLYLAASMLFLGYSGWVIFRFGWVALQETVNHFSLLQSFQIQSYVETVASDTWTAAKAQWLSLLAPLALLVAAGVGLVVAGLMLVSRVFSHSKYWTCDLFYEDVLNQLIAPRPAPTNAVSNIDVVPQPRHTQPAPDDETPKPPEPAKRKP